MLSIPQPWKSAPEEQQRFFARVAGSRRSVLLTDYDGTLAPFRKDKMQAFPYPGLAERLACLASMSNVRVVFVTGRIAGELKELLSISAPVEIWGSHGREHIDAEGQYTLFPLTAEQQEALDDVQATLEDKGYQQSIERKPTSLAVHWRGADLATQAQLEELTRSLAEQYTSENSFETISFEAGMEIRATGRTKANVVCDVLQEESTDTVSAYLGDDRTDEDAFPMLRERGVSVLVRPEVRESEADFWMNPPDDVIDFFDQWIHSARSRS